jgi:hypothetical protein
LWGSSRSGGVRTSRLELSGTGDVGGIRCSAKPIYGHMVAPFLRLLLLLPLGFLWEALVLLFPASLVSRSLLQGPKVGTLQIASVKLPGRGKLNQ